MSHWNAPYVTFCQTTLLVAIDDFETSRSLCQRAPPEPGISVITSPQLDLQSLHTPSCPWSQTLCFSNTTHFIPLLKLPSSLKTTQLLVQCVFLLHGIPFDTVSDQRPQFIWQVWKMFCQALGAFSSSTFRYHPQSNGQTNGCNQEEEAALSCVIDNHSTSLCQQLP